MLRTRALQVALPSHPLRREGLPAVLSQKPLRTMTVLTWFSSPRNASTEKNPPTAALTRKKTTYSPEVSDCETVSIATFLQDDDAEQPQKDDKQEIDSPLRKKYTLVLTKKKRTGNDRTNSSKIYKKKWCP